MEIPPSTPLSAEAREIKRFLIHSQENHYRSLYQAGIVTELGFGLLGSETISRTGPFTGAGLCLYSAALLRDDLSGEFPKIKVSITKRTITTRHNHSGYTHYSPRLILTDGTGMFADGTYQQIAPYFNRLNLDGIVVDLVENEPYYYGANARAKLYTRNISPDQVLAELQEKAQLRRASRYGHYGASTILWV